MVEVTLSDGRRCRLVAHRQSPSGDAPAGAAPRLVVRCEIEGEEPFELPIDAGWKDAERLPAGLADLIIRHFLLA